MNKYSKSKAMAKSKPRQNSNRGSFDPPQMNMQPTFRRRMRFLNSADVTCQDVIKSIDVLGALGCLATATNIGTESFTIASAARIKSVEIWGAPKSDSTGAWCSAVVEWKNSTSFSKSTRVEDVSISNARPLHVFTKPPKNSVSDLWFHGPAVELFHIKVPPGAIIDLVVEFLICDIKEPLSVTLPAIASEGDMIFTPLNLSSLNCLPQIDRDT